MHGRCAGVFQFSVDFLHKVDFFFPTLSQTSRSHFGKYQFPALQSSVFKQLRLKMTFWMCIEISGCNIFMKSVAMLPNRSLNWKSKLELNSVLFWGFFRLFWEQSEIVSELKPSWVVVKSGVTSVKFLIYHPASPQEWILNVVFSIMANQSLNTMHASWAFRDFTSCPENTCQ